jgi:hypothetical protein
MKNGLEAGAAMSPEVFITAIRNTESQLDSKWRVYF